MISDRTLRKTYGLTDDQISRVHYLVDRQVEQLGSVVQNHGHYVKRAAETVRDGEDGLLDQLLSEFRQMLVAKQNAKSHPVGSRPAFFHRMYTEALEKRRPSTPAEPVVPAPPSRRQPTVHRSEAADVARLFAPPEEDLTDDSRARLIADAERRGVAVPTYIRTADVRAVNRWWAALPDTDAKSHP